MSEDYIIICDNNLLFTNRILDALSIQQLDVDKDLTNIKKYNDVRRSYDNNPRYDIIQEPEQEEPEQEPPQNFFSKLFGSKKPIKQNKPYVKPISLYKYYYVKLHDLLSSETDLSNFTNNKNLLNTIFSCVEKINNSEYNERTDEYTEYEYYPRPDNEDNMSPGDWGAYRPEPEIRRKYKYNSKEETNKILNTMIEELLDEIRKKTHSSGGKPSPKRKPKKTKRRKNAQKKNTKKRSRK